MNAIRAWHGEPGLKEAALKQLRGHRDRDEIVQGHYWKNGRGCDLGCLTHCNQIGYENSTLVYSNSTGLFVYRAPHEAAERMFGIEISAALFLEFVFEAIPAQMCVDWVIDSAETIAVGADLSGCLKSLLNYSNGSVKCAINSSLFTPKEIISKSLEILRSAPIIQGLVEPIPDDIKVELTEKGLLPSYV